MTFIVQKMRIDLYLKNLLISQWGVLPDGGDLDKDKVKVVVESNGDLVTTFQQSVFK